MSAVSVNPKTGNVRLRLETHTGRPFLVGPFGTLGGARRMAEDLIAAGAVRSVLAQHKNAGCWKPCWSWAAEAQR